ncbi:TPA: restriction endonuclease subunit S [Photobacterium damselae]
MSELPKGWVSVCLNDVVDKIVGGGTPSKSKPSYYTGEIPWMTVKDMNKLYLTDTIDHITQEAVDNSSTNVIPAGTPIIATRMSLGKIVRANFDSAINQDLKAIFVNSSINKFYFEYWYRSKSMLIESLGTGTTVKGVRLEVLKDLKFPLSSLAEQKRIVEKLDEVLAQIDTIKAHLDGIPAILKRFRQSVLAAAVSGKLTEEWRGNSGYKKHDLCDDWQWGTVPFEWTVKFYPELVESRLGKMLDKSKNEGNPTKYLGNINVRWFDTNLSNVQDILVSDKEQKELALSVGDVLICEGGEPGRCCIWNKNLEEVIIFQKALHRARVKKEIIPEWLTYNLKRDADGLILNQLFTGTTIKHLTGKALKKYPLRVPSLEEQKEIVRLVDQYFAFADTIEVQVKKTQARVDNLTPSILAKAFRGELVEQDPNDEPADKLLERIAAARKEAEALAKAAKKAQSTKSVAKKKTAKSA